MNISPIFKQGSGQKAGVSLRKPPLKYIIIPLVVLLAALCIGGAELAASYFFAPEFFEKITAPVRRGTQAVITFCQDTASFCQDQALELGSEALAFIDRITEPPPQPDPLPEADTSQQTELSEENQFSDGILYEITVNFADPSITELKWVDGVEILTGGVVELRYFCQSLPPWAEEPYGSDDIGHYGCGPTAMAMVISSFTDEVWNPRDMAQWAVEHHHWAKGSGSYLSIVPDTAEAFGLSARSLEKTTDAIQSALLSGELVVALMGPGHFTKGGHFILIHGLTLSGSFLVADPNSPDRSLMEWEGELLVEELSRSTSHGAPLWAIARS